MAWTLCSCLTSEDLVVLMQKAPLQIWCSHDILLEQLQVTVHAPHSASLPVACSHARTNWGSLAAVGMQAA